jgi:hypothetical protein
MVSGEEALRWYGKVKGRETRLQCLPRRVRWRSRSPCRKVGRRNWNSKWRGCRGVAQGEEAGKGTIRASCQSRICGFG